jgi:hypothetical protein
MGFLYPFGGFLDFIFHKSIKRRRRIWLPQKRERVSSSFGDSLEFSCSFYVDKHNKLKHNN